jgi:hypothetical protein
VKLSNFFSLEDEKNGGWYVGDGLYALERYWVQEHMVGTEEIKTMKQRDRKDSCLC